MNMPGKKTQVEKEARVAEEYLSSLSDLNCNSKPLINMLTMLAEENMEFAAVIVKVVESHILKVQADFKLPILYLIDSIVKNVKNTYVQLFSQCIVNIFCGVFEKVNEKVRERMYALRQTWNEVFSSQKLYALDVKVKNIDNNWPITAKTPQPSIHVNPNFLKTVPAIPADMEEILQVKTRELLELRKRKLELELEATKKHLEEQEKQLTKTTENIAAASVVPVGGMNAAQQMPPQQLMAAGGILRTGLVAGAHPHMHPGVTAAASGIRPPAMYHNNNFRAPRPQQHAGGMLAMQHQSYLPNNNTNMNKPKVHPVNPAMVNTMRHRDPRLARQLQQQQQQQQLQNVQTARGGMGGSSSSRTEDSKTDERGKSSSPNYRSSKSRSGSSGGAGFGSESKPSPSYSRFSGRSSKSGNTSSRDKEKNHKRSESKSSTTSSSSAGSISSSSERHKNSGSSSSRNKTSAAAASSTSSSKCDKDAFEIASLSTAFKRKSTSPPSSPIKSRDAKRLMKSRNYGSNSGSNDNKNHSHARSRSPIAVADIDSTKDIDLRTHPPVVTSSTTISSSTVSPDKHLKQRHKTADSAELLIEKDSDTSRTTNIMDGGSKDLDKKHLSTAATTSSISNAPITATAMKSLHLLSPKSKLDDDVNMEATAATTAGGHQQQQQQQRGRADELMVIENAADPEDVGECDGKKRPSPKTETEEPLSKKSKSAKFDALFGSEDVDLRTAMPPQILIAQKQAAVSGVSTPPPPMISAENDEQNAAQKQTQKSIGNWDNLKTSAKTSSSSSMKTSSPKKISSLDDVRAKLAKAAKFNNKLGKFEKSNRELAQRLKLDELHMNEDSQEANEDKIRILITQAQDMLDTKSIGQEQYNSLMQTVMSINESSKLRAAKRIAEASKTAAAENDDDAIEAERLAKRDAILKKRIPKLSKLNQVDNKSLGAHLSDSANSGDSPIYEDRKKSNDDAAPIAAASSKPKSSRDKRIKPSKWSERVDTTNNVPGAGSSVVAAPLPQRNWLPNKRGGYRGNIPHPPLPPLINSNLRQQPQMPPWQMQQQNPVMMPMPFAPNTAMPPQMLHGGGGGNVPPPPRPPAPVLPAIPKPCNSIDNPQADVVRTITIDGLAKEIRIYDQVAIVFMETDQPREIGFQAGQRSIIIDNGERITLQFNDDYKPYNINGKIHRMRFGFPSRELYIDEHWYEIYFGGPPVSIPINSKIHILKAEGPPPQVNIGALRLDLVVGKINMIVDALIVIPLFLDARLQTFHLGEKEHVIQFADKLLTVLLDGEPYSVEYGGLPKSFTLGGKKYFIRFSALPHGVTVGMVNIKDMRYVKTQPPPAAESIESGTMVTTTTNESNAKAISQPPTSDTHPEQISLAATTTAETASVGAVLPITTTASSATTASIAGVLPATQLNNINIDELFQKLVSSGILGGSASILPVAGVKMAAVDKSTAIAASNIGTKSSAVAPATEVISPIRPIDLANSETIKTRQAAIVATLFSGMQCSSCGVRFPPEQTIKYSQHLDWHFRHNRRERDSSRKALSRKWYYDLNDWIQYEEIEDLEEREKNFFETQQNEMDIIDDTSNQCSTNSPVASCAALPEDVDRSCDVCQEKFEQFYNEDLEEWHLRSAIRVEDKIYHPLCYEDYKTSLNPRKPELKDKDEKMLDTEDNNAVDIIIKIEGDEKCDGESGSGDKSSVTIEDDDDDDVIVVPNEEPSVTEIVDDDDDEEYVPSTVTREEMGVKSDDTKTAEDGNGGDVSDTMESDVEIQEPNIPFTDLDTYEEKELPEGDETSQMSFMNMKIKEEPKEEEEDEDDGFEDVGTVHNIPDEEISIQSSEETQTHTITSDASPLSATERPPSSTSLVQILDNTESSEASATAALTTTVDDRNNISIDGNIEVVDEHNLSTAGPAPALPLASLVNKIKINITKNIVSTNNSSSSSTTTTTTSATTSTASTSNSLNCNLGPNNSNYIPTVVSTIPVLCGGGTISTIVSSSSSMLKPPNGGNAVAGSAKNDPSGNNCNVSSISVIGSSYGSTSIPNKTYYRPAEIPAPTKAPAATSFPVRQPTPPAEEQISYELKPSLQKASLKKMQKVKCGVETSGLCSIM